MKGSIDWQRISENSIPILKMDKCMLLLLSNVSTKLSLAWSAVNIRVKSHRFLQPTSGRSRQGRIRGLVVLRSTITQLKVASTPRFND